MSDRYNPHRNSHSIKNKIVLVFIVVMVLICACNILMYVNVNRITTRLDESYISNVKLSRMEDALSMVQSSLLEYLNTKTTDAMGQYYRHRQEYAGEIDTLLAAVTDSPSARMERNIKYMSDTYLALTDMTVEAKRGRNINKYKEYYEQTEEYHRYLENYIISLNNSTFRENTESYEVLSRSLQTLEMISTAVFALVALVSILFAIRMTDTIVRPLGQLSLAANQVANGKLYEVEIVPVRTQDEVGVVTGAFNQMLVSIRGYIEKMKENMENERAMKEKELLMETHLKDAQLKLLQAQINPHFLFNTLNAGAQLAMMEEADRTYDYIQNVADFFRYNIKKDKDIVTLAEEIRLVDNYIYIINVRFSGDIHFKKEVDETVLGVKVPGMILQPIVENAVNYGIRNIDRVGVVELSVTSSADQVCICILDNGVGIPQEKIAEIYAGNAQPQEDQQGSNGVGLKNVIDRLHLFFGGREEFIIESGGADQGTKVVVRIPK